MREGDVIVSVNGVEQKGTGPRYIVRAIQDAPAGTKLSLRVMRAGKPKDLVVTARAAPNQFIMASPQALFLGSPPAAETDGPVGAALLVKGFESVGIRCRLATDEPCRSACAAALAGAGISHVPVDAGNLVAVVDEWRRAGITHAISIERCGRSADGAPRNMRGLDISSYTAPLDELFMAGPWETIAIGDGGNEIGMGSLPRELIARHIENGAAIACVTPARHLMVAGVSNWGAYALLAALAVLRDDWRKKILGCLDPALDKAVLEAVVLHGPAVDGVSRLRAMTVDSLDLAIHHDKLREIRALAEAVDGV